MSSTVNDEVDLVKIIFGFLGLVVFLLIIGIYQSQAEYNDLQSKIPSMDCKELTKIHNKYDYWLDDDEDLFNAWYERMTEMRCIIP